MFFSWRQTPIYESTAKVLVKPVTLSAGVSGSTQGVPPNLETEKELAASTEVAKIAARQLRLAAPPQSLLANLTVGTETISEIMTVTYADPDPAAAQARAQAFADAYLTFRREQAVDDLLASSDSVQEQIQSLNAQLEDVQAEIARENDEAQQATLTAQANTLVSQLAVLQQQLANLTPPDNLRVGQVVAPAELPLSPARTNFVQNGLLAVPPDW